MLYIFDKDNTLVSGLKDRPANTPDEQSLLPNVVEVIAGLIAAGHRIAIASNQGGVEMGYLTHIDAINLLVDCAVKIGATQADLDFCPHFHFRCECRKPKPGMLLRLMARAGFLDGREVIMVGDQESDRLAAAAAGCRFIWAAEFFGWNSIGKG